MQERVRDVEHLVGELGGDVGAAEDVGPSQAQVGRWATGVKFLGWRVSAWVGAGGEVRYLVGFKRDDFAAVRVRGCCCALGAVYPEHAADERPNRGRQGW